MLYGEAALAGVMVAALEHPDRILPLGGGSGCEQRIQRDIDQSESGCADLAGDEISRYRRRRRMLDLPQSLLMRQLRGCRFLGCRQLRSHCVNLTLELLQSLLFLDVTPTK